MNRPLIFLFGLSLFALLGYFCIYTQVFVIQNDIDTRTHTAFVEQNLNDINITTDGRDIFLQGEVDSIEIKTRANEIAQQVDGVRIVNNELIIAVPEVKNENPTPQTESSTVEDKKK